MSKTVKIVILILTILPVLVFILGYFGMILGMLSQFPMHHFPGPGQEPPWPSVRPMIWFFVSISFAMLVGLGMLIFYIINLIQTDRVPKDLKPVWGILFFLGWWVAWVVYWFIYIWPEPATETTRTIPTPPEHHTEA